MNLPVTPKPPGSIRASEWISATLLALILAAVATASIHGADFRAGRAPALTFSAATALFGVVLTPAHLFAPGGLMLWSAAIGTSFSLASVALPAIGADELALLAPTVTLLIFAVAGARQLIAHWRGTLLANALIAAVAFDLAIAPLALSPLAGHFSEHTWFTSMLVNASPLTHLAAILDVDYLRVNWFYEHARVGSLRFEYLSKWTASLAWALIALATAALLHLKSPTEGRQQE